MSRGTVSLVLNQRTDGRVPISDETQARVLQAAAALGYAPNPVAQMLAQGNHCLIGVFTYDRGFPYETDDFFFPYLTGIQSESSQQDYNVLLFTRHQDNGHSHVYHNAMNSLLLADGSILMGVNTDKAELRRLHDEGYPFVYIGRREIPGCEIDWVIHDYRAGTVEATRYLLDLGHRKLAYVGGNKGGEPQEDKLAGCLEVIDGQAGVELSRFYLTDFDDLAALAGTVVDSGITAVLCDTREIFENLLQQFHAMQVRVPADLSLVSMTTADICPPYMLPPTHIQLNQRLVGEAAVRILIQRISGETDGPQQVLLPCKFVPGQTTGAVST